MSKLFCGFLLAFGITLAQASPNHSFAGDQKSILVTGASSGIGRNLAEALAGKGYHVYAGARKDQDLKELDAIENITAAKLDVTRQDEVDAVVELINAKNTGLYGLVNNAGVGGERHTVVDGPIDAQRFIYAVNVEGVYRTTKAFAPLVMISRGRIVTTGSIAGTYRQYRDSVHMPGANTGSRRTPTLSQPRWRRTVLSSAL